MSGIEQSVALVRVSSEHQPEVAVSADGDRWYVAGPRLGSQHGWYADRIEILRPLVVLDPEDDVQAERLTKAFVANGVWRTIPADVDSHAYRREQIRAAIAALVLPPKPAEPTGLGAVVEDGNGDAWVHDRDASPGYLGVEWLNVRTRAHRRYDDISVARVLSEGVAT